jgi:hypothetical protein
VCVVRSLHQRQKSSKRTAGFKSEQTWSLEFPSNPAFTMTPTMSPTIQNQACPIVGRTVAAPHNRRGGEASDIIGKSLYFNGLAHESGVARALV